jgi:tetratricopeptide (TPR) repeat protein
LLQSIDDYLNEGEPNAKVGEWKYSQTYKMAFKEYRAANIELMICSVYPTPGQPVPSAYVDAIEHYQKAVSFEPRIPEWQEALAETYLLARRYTAAISAAKNAFALYQSVPQGSVSNATFEQLQINEGQDLDMQGNADYYLRQYDAAVSQYQAALKIEPMNSENLAMRINLGRALFAAGHKQAAVAAWKDVLHHLPGGPGNTEISDPAKQLLKNPNAKVYSLQ